VGDNLISDPIPNPASEANPFALNSLSSLIPEGRQRPVALLSFPGCCPWSRSVRVSIIREGASLLQRHPAIRIVYEVW